MFDIFLDKVLAKILEIFSICFNFTTFLVGLKPTCDAKERVNPVLVRVAICMYTSSDGDSVPSLRELILNGLIDGSLFLWGLRSLLNATPRWVFWPRCWEASIYMSEIRALLLDNKT